MLKKISQSTIALAAASMAMAPVAAQANTRAGDSSVTYATPASQPGAGRQADGEELGRGGNVFAYFLAGLWLAGIVLIIVDVNDDDDDRQSPGT